MVSILSLVAARLWTPARHALIRLAVHLMAVCARVLLATRLRRSARLHRPDTLCLEASQRSATTCLLYHLYLAVSRAPAQSHLGVARVRVLVVSIRIRRARRRAVSAVQ